MQSTREQKGNDDDNKWTAYGTTVLRCFKGAPNRRILGQLKSGAGSPFRDLARKYKVPSEYIYPR